MSKIMLQNNFKTIFSWYIMLGRYM
jgi:hypothetical protein